MPAAPLAALAPLPAPIPAETRLAYVLRHFWQVYGPARPVSVGEASSGAQVEVVAGAERFFTQTEPFPPPPVWRVWQGQRVPFFFTTNTDTELLTRQPGRAVISADIISAAFFLLSGWQEYFSPERDAHGRFPYAASVQFQYDFIGLPVVNYYFDLLKTAVEHVTGQPLAPRRWGSGGAPLAAFGSHDVDLLRGAWKDPVKQALRRGRWGEALGRLWRRLRRPDAWDNLEQVAAETSRYGGRSTFFILPCPHPAPDGTPNADYRLTPRLRARLTQLAAQGHEIGLHGSIGSSVNAAQWQQEHALLPAPGPGHRFHYLKWEPRRTPALLDDAGLGYDCTLGFAEHFGFRHSYCHPFQLFDFQRQTAHCFVEIPLLLMDTTLHHPRYLQLSAAEVLPAVRPVLAEVERFGGVAAVLWHNNHFDSENQVNGPEQFHGLMRDLQQRGAAFLTGAETAAHFQFQASLI